MGVGEEAVSVRVREREEKEEKKGRRRRRKKKEGERKSGKGSSFSPLNTQRSARFPLLEVDVSFRESGEKQRVMHPTRPLMLSASRKKKKKEKKKKKGRNQFRAFALTRNVLHASAISHFSSSYLSSILSRTTE